VSDGKIVFYTCGASKFILNPTGDISDEAMFWYKASDGVTLSGSNISQWNDQATIVTPNANVTMNTLATAPVYFSGDASSNFQPYIYSMGNQFLRADLGVGW
jgi:hypothetical protein